MPKTVLAITEDPNARFGAIGGQVFVALDGHNAHGWDDLEDSFGKAMEAALFPERDFYVGVVLDEASNLLEVGVLPGRAVHKILVVSSEE